MHPEFSYIVESATHHFEKVNVISNGSNPVALKEVIGKASVWVSLDYYGYRQDETRGLKGLFYNYQQLADYVDIRTTLLCDNLVDVMKIVFSAFQRNRHATVAPYRGISQALAPTPQDMGKLLQFIFKNGYEKNVVIDDCSIRKYIANRQGKKDYVGCNACESIIQVNAKGMVTPCPFLQNEIASVYDENIKEKIMDTRKQLLNSFSGKCVSCIYNKTCGGCKTGSNSHCFITK